MKPGIQTRKPAAILAAASFAIATVLSPLPAAAELISTDQIIAQSNIAAERSKLNEFLTRDDVARQMSHLGVGMEETKARVAALSDAEVARIAGQLNTLPAGEGIGALIALAGLVFLILLVTDFVGATDVFTFVQ